MNCQYDRDLSSNCITNIPWTYCKKQRVEKLISHSRANVKKMKPKFRLYFVSVLVGLVEIRLDATSRLKLCDRVRII